MKTTPNSISARQRHFILHSPLAVCLWLFLIFICLVELAQEYGEGLVNLPGNILNLARLRNDLSHATELWRSNDVVSYDIDVEGLIPLGCQFNVTLEVRQGKVAGVIPHENGAGHLQTLEPEGEGKCTYTFLLIPSMLESTKRYVEHANPLEGYLEVSFDPDYGFVNDYRAGSYGWYDGFVWFTYHNFKPLAP